MDQVSLGRRIKDLREREGLHQEELANLLIRDAIRHGRGDDINCSVSFVSRLERGKGGESRYEDLRAFARVLHTHVGYIVDGDDPNLARAIEAFSASESAAKAMTDIANFYHSAHPDDRDYLDRLFDKIAVWCRLRYADPLDLRSILSDIPVKADEEGDDEAPDGAEAMYSTR